MRFLDNFKFESKEQEQGVMNLVLWCRKNGFDPEQIRPADAYFIQKDHDAYLYWRELFAVQVKNLQDEIAILQGTCRELQQRCEDLKSVNNAAR